MSSSDRVRVRRQPERGSYDPATIHGILDEALVCHLGFEHEGHPFVIPTIHVRIDDRLYVHGSVASRALRVLRDGLPCCITVTLLDGIVLARSAFHHSMNYRSVVVLGRAREVTDREQKLAVLHALAEHVVPGRWDDCRRPNEAELEATSVLEIPLDEASAKVRTGPPGDDPADIDLDHWAGVIPLALVAGAPEPDARVATDRPAPGYTTAYVR